MSNSLDNMSLYYQPNTLDGLSGVAEQIAGDALLVDGTNMMIADLNMNFHNIKNLQTPTLDDEAATKGYVDVNVDTRLNVNGGSLLGNLNMTSHKITGLLAGTLSTDAVNKGQLDLKADTSYVNSTFLNKKTTDIADGMKIWQNIQIHSAVSVPNSEQINETTIFHSRDLIPKWSEGIVASGDDFIISRWTGVGTSNDIIKFRHTTNDIQFNQPLTMSSAKITGLADGTTTGDAVNYGQLVLKADTSYVNSLDAQNVKISGAQTIAGIKTFSSSPIVPTATTATQAANLGNITTALVPYALDANVVHNFGAETIAGNKTFTGQMRVSCAAPQIIFDVSGGLTGSYLQVGGGGTVTLHSASTLQLDASTGYNINLNIGGGNKMSFSSAVANVYVPFNMNTSKIQSLANGTVSGDAVNFSQLDLKYDKSGGLISGPVTIETTNTQLTLRVPTATSSVRMGTDVGGTLSLKCDGNCYVNAVNSNNIVLQSGNTDKLTIGSTTLISSVPLSMNSQKIQALADGTVSTDAASYGQLTTVDGNAVHKTGDETIAGIKTFSSSPIVPTATTSTQAINKGQMDTEFSAKERIRLQAPYCKAWRKVGGVDTSINTMGLSWSADALSPVANSSVWGLEHTLVNDGVFVRTDMTLYKGDVINGFYFGCKAPDDNGSVVKIFVYNFTDNLVATTEASTCANQSVVYCPFTSAWTVPSTQTYKICIVWQSGGVNHILTCISTWVIWFNQMSAAYNNTYINQTNKTPPSFYDLTDVTLGRTPIIYAYRTI